MLNLSFSQVNQITVVRLVGALDSSASVVASRQIATLCAQEYPRLALDLSKLVYVTSAGLRMFYEVVVAVRDKGRVVLFAPNREVGDALALVGLPLLVSVCPDLDAAIAAFDQPSGAA